MIRDMKKVAKVEYGIQIVKPWSKEMYDHNDAVAIIVRDIIDSQLDDELNSFVSGYDASDEAMEQDWNCVSIELKSMQRAITCYSYGIGFEVAEVIDEIKRELENAPLYRLKEIAEELELELEKGFIGFK